tara:strand:+ start:483 stop:857 length:375 start_codon:yes stop_codon:yes gene_type:complete
MIKGILIDPFDQTYSEVELSEDSTFADAKKHMQLDGPLDVVTLSDDTMVIVDDEALLKNDQRYFKLTEFHQPLAGRAIIVGYDDEGETQTPEPYDVHSIEWMPEDHVEEPFMQFIPIPDEKEKH